MTKSSYPRGAGRWDNSRPKLLHHAQPVRNCPSDGKTAGGDAEDADYVPSRLPTGGRDPTSLALLRSSLGAMYRD